MEKEVLKKRLESVGCVAENDKSIIKAYENYTELLSGVITDSDDVLGASLGLCNHSLGLIVFTHDRLVFAGSMKAIYKTNTTIEEIYYDKITSIIYKKGWMPTASLFLTVSGNKIELGGIKPQKALQFKDILNNKINSIKTPTSPITAQLSIADELQKLALLKDKGILNDLEFQSQKDKLLGL